MKNLFNSLGIIVFLKKLYEYRKLLNMVLLPFYAFYGLIWILLLLGSFLSWSIPTHIPFPFIGNSIGDRFLLLIGLVIGIVYYHEYFKNKKK